jgi:hypothetical protein
VQREEVPYNIAQRVTSQPLRVGEVAVNSRGDRRIYQMTGYIKCAEADGVSRVISELYLPHMNC